MFALFISNRAVPEVLASVAFPVHQYYPTGSKKTDPNDIACRQALTIVLNEVIYVFNVSAGEVEGERNGLGEYPQMQLLVINIINIIGLIIVMRWIATSKGN